MIIKTRSKSLKPFLVLMTISIGHYIMRKKRMYYLPYTRTSKKKNKMISVLMKDYNRFVKKAHRFGMDVKFSPCSKETLQLYFHDDYPNLLLVDKETSCETQDS